MGQLGKDKIPMVTTFLPQEAIQRYRIASTQQKNYEELVKEKEQMEKQLNNNVKNLEKSLYLGIGIFIFLLICMQIDSQQNQALCNKYKELYLQEENSQNHKEEADINPDTQYSYQDLIEIRTVNENLISKLNQKLQEEKKHKSEIKNEKSNLENNNFHLQQQLKNAKEELEYQKSENLKEIQNILKELEELRKKGIFGFASSSFDEIKQYDYKEKFETVKNWGKDLFKSFQSTIEDQNLEKRSEKQDNNNNNRRGKRRGQSRSKFEF